MNNKILFRINAGNHEGYGHLSRNLVLSSSLELLGACTFFLIKTDNSESVKNFVKRKGAMINIIFIDSEKDEKFDLAQIESVYKTGFDLLVIDHYQHGDSYYKFLKKKGINWAQYDYKYDKKILASIVINPNIGVTDEDYNSIVNKTTLKLIGDQYILVGAEFIKNKKNIQTNKVKNIVVTLGGGIYKNDRISILQNLIKFTSYNYHIIAPHGNDFDFLKSKNVTLYVDPDNIVEVFKKADLTICSGGVTSYELAVMRIPLIVIAIADNQINNVIAWKNYNTGFCFENIKFFLDKIENIGFAELLNETLRIYKYSKTYLINSDGSKLLANKILDFVQSQTNTNE